MQAISSAILDLGKPKHSMWQAQVHQQDALADMGATSTFMLPTTENVRHLLL